MRPICWKGEVPPRPLQPLPLTPTPLPVEEGLFGAGESLALQNTTVLSGVLSASEAQSRRQGQGKGVRFWGLTTCLPKVGGRLLIDYGLPGLSAQG